MSLLSGIGKIAGAVLGGILGSKATKNNSKLQPLGIFGGALIGGTIASRLFGNNHRCNHGRHHGPHGYNPWGCGRHRGGWGHYGRGYGHNWGGWCNHGPYGHYGHQLRRVSFRSYV